MTCRRNLAGSTRFPIICFNTGSCMKLELASPCKLAVLNISSFTFHNSCLLQSPPDQISREWLIRKKNRCDSFSFMFQNCPRPANVVISYHSFACTLCEHCTQLNQLQCHVQLAQEDLREHRAALACATCKHSRSRIDAHSGDEPTYLLQHPFFYKFDAYLHHKNEQSTGLCTPFGSLLLWHPSAEGGQHYESRAHSERERERMVTLTTDTDRNANFLKKQAWNGDSVCPRG